MQRIYPTHPYFPISPDDFTSTPEYCDFTPLDSIFSIMGMSVKTDNDAFCITDTITELTERLHSLQTLPKSQLITKYSIKKPSRTSVWSLDKVMIEFQNYPTHDYTQHITPIMTAPLITRYTYYHACTAFIAHKGYPTHRHIISIPNNPTLVISKRTNNPTLAHSPFITTNLPLQQCLATGTSVGAYSIPFYLDNTGLFNTAQPYIPNITHDFIKSLEAKYNLIPDTMMIMGYIYSILWHKGYRTRYCQQLRLDYPRIPLVSTLAKFLALCTLGWELYNLHINAPEPPNQM